MRGGLCWGRKSCMDEVLPRGLRGSWGEMARVGRLCSTQRWQLVAGGSRNSGRRCRSHGRGEEGLRWPCASRSDVARGSEDSEDRWSLFGRLGEKERVGFESRMHSINGAASSVLSACNSAMILSSSSRSKRAKCLLR